MQAESLAGSVTMRLARHPPSFPLSILLGVTLFTYINLTNVHTFYFQSGLEYPHLFSWFILACLKPRWLLNQTCFIGANSNQRVDSRGRDDFRWALEIMCILPEVTLQLSAKPNADYSLIWIDIINWFEVTFDLTSSRYKSREDQN